jgi:hypothetical protein
MDERSRSESLNQAAKLLSKYCCRSLGLGSFSRNHALKLLEGLRSFAKDDDDIDMLVPLISQARIAL